MKCIMASSLVLCLLLTGWCAAEPPEIRPNPIPVLPDWEAIDHAVLESCRQHCTFLKREIAWKEKELENLKALTTPEMIRKIPELSVRIPELNGLILKQLEQDREDLKKHEKWVQEMERFEQQRKLNPGSGTNDEGMARLEKLYQELWGPPPVAPPPREVKK